LGMSIIKTIVEWHQGKIWFESSENKGTTFYISLPK
jgi:two-component system sensor histidine kinase VicK